MMKFESLTVPQLLLAAGKARGMNTASLCHAIGCTEPYYYKLKKEAWFQELITKFKGADTDPDNLKFVNSGTLIADVGKFLYHYGIKKIHGEIDE